MPNYALAKELAIDTQSSDEIIIKDSSKTISALNIKNVVDSIIAPIKGSKLTLPIPSTWPPINDDSLEYYVYRLGSPTDGGMITYLVSTPFQKITLHLNKSNLKIKKHKLKTYPLSNSASRGFWEFDSLKYEANISNLLTSIKEGVVPEGEKSSSVKEYYKQWFHSHNYLKGFLRKFHPDFIYWLYEE